MLATKTRAAHWNVVGLHFHALHALFQDQYEALEAAVLANLLADHEAVARTLRADLTAALERYGDAGTSDLLTELLGKHEKMAWMLRAHLEA